MNNPRPYRDDNDYFLIRRFLQAGRQFTGPFTSLFHVGDVTWQRFMYPRDIFPPEERIALWEGGSGELEGFAWYYRKSTEVVLQIDPRINDSAQWRALADSMLAWAEARSDADTAATSSLSIPEFESDTRFATYMTERGFARSDATAMRFHHQELTGDLPAPVLPEGFVVRPIDGDDDAEIEQRVQIHREVWHPSKFTVGGYRQLRSSPGYDPELDLVAVSPDGTFAAYTICWIDEVNRSGEFEPVGAREAFRGRGLTKAVMHEALHRLRARGCDSACVNSYESNTAACGLYEAAGFRMMDRWVSYERPKLNP